MHIILRKYVHLYIRLWALFSIFPIDCICAGGTKEEATCLQWPIEQFHSHFYDLLMLFQADKHNLTRAHTSLALGDLYCRRRNWLFNPFFLFLKIFLCLSLTLFPFIRVSVPWVWKCRPAWPRALSKMVLSKEKQRISVWNRKRTDLCGSPAFLNCCLFLTWAFVNVGSREHDRELVQSALGHERILKGLLNIFCFCCCCEWAD